MAKKKSYMDKDNILSESVLSTIIGWFLSPKIDKILRQIKDDPELRRATKDASSSMRRFHKLLDKDSKKREKLLRKMGIKPITKKW
tara:strand:- start:272 stop:529 length:258 start_codon:yes stop_codon:yes gene_type:complete